MGTGAQWQWSAYPQPFRIHRPIWSIITMATSGILLMASVVAAFAYYPSRGPLVYLIATVAKSQTTMMILGTIITMILCAGMFLATALVYFGCRVLGGIIGFTFAVASIVTGGGFIAGLVLGMIGGCLAILGK